MILCYAMEPEIYLFDEPTANLDIQSIFDLRDILRRKNYQYFTLLVGLFYHIFFICSDALPPMFSIQSFEAAEKP